MKGLQKGKIALLEQDHEARAPESSSELRFQRGTSVRRAITHPKVSSYSCCSRRVCILLLIFLLPPSATEQSTTESRTRPEYHQTKLYVRHYKTACFKGHNRICLYMFASGYNLCSHATVRINSRVLELCSRSPLMISVIRMDETSRDKREQLRQGPNSSETV